MTDFWQSLTAIDLAEIPADFQLQTRVDRKYLVPASTLYQVVETLDEQIRIITVENKLRANYESNYFDNLEFDLHRAAAFKRRNRYKIRTRKYVDSALEFLELKIKISRGKTVKVRTAIPDTNAALQPAAKAWIKAELDKFGLTPISNYQLALANSFKRRTLILDGGSRFTVDSELAFNSIAAFNNNNEWRLVETKSYGRISSLDIGLWRAGFRPMRISKYGIGIGLSHLDQPSNKWHRAIEMAFKNGEFADHYRLRA